MKYLSLFSGIGGFELGIKKAYESNNEHAHISEEPEQEERSQGGLGPSNLQRVLVHAGDRTAPLCIGYSEIDKYATQIYQKHFPNHKNYGDITKINADTLPDFDLLVGGFPCQAFSIAGKRRGFDDTRGTLFFEIARILGTKRPRLLLLENVKGLLNHDDGRTFEVIICTLDELGYDVQWQVLNSKNHGVPQNRERVFIVGHLRGTPRPQVFPFIGIHEEVNELNQVGVVGKDSEATRVYDTDGISRTIKNGGGMGAKTGLYIKPLVSKTVRSGGRGSPHGSKQNWDSYDIAGGVRRLTPIECERLQGFPDGWTEGISDSQRYKCCGNAVTVNVVRDVIQKML